MEYSVLTKKYLKCCWWLTLIIVFHIQSAAQPSGYFRDPLDIPIKLAANFGEIRPDHFHTGFDIRTNEKTEWKETTDMHGGGDWRLVANWIQAIAKKDPSLLTSTIDQSIESHVMGFMAEESRKSKRVMEVKM